MILLATELPAWFYPTAIPLGILLVYLFVIPLLIAQTLKLSGNPKIIEFDPEETPPPETVRSYFSKNHQALTDLGFERLSACVMPEPMPNIRTVLTLYAHSQNSDAAMVAVTWGIVEGADAIQSKFVEFQSEFSEGYLKIIDTTNNTEVDPFITPDDQRRFRFPSLSKPSSIATLYQYHQKLVEQKTMGQKKKLTVIKDYHHDVSAYLKKEVLRKSYQKQVDFGLLKYNKKTSNFTPTFLGSYNMIWKCLPPFKQIIQAKHRQAERKLTKEISNEFSS